MPATSFSLLLASSKLSDVALLTPHPPAVPLLQALSDAHTYLFEERERLLALQAECDALRLQEVEDRTRIKQLLSLTHPVEHKLVYGQGARGIENGPHSSAAFPRGGNSGEGGAAPGGCKSPRRGGRGAGSERGGIVPGQQPQRILRTVYLPTAQSEALALKCEALAAQLAEQKRFAAERVAALTEDRAIRERDSAAAAAALSRTAEELAERLRGAEEALRRTTKDYILARQERDAAQQEAAAARAAAAAERQQARHALDAAQQRAAGQLQALRQEVDAESSAATQALQARLAQRGEELVKFETFHKLIRAQLEARARDAERRAARLAARCRDLQHRRAHEMEGWAADVGQLRKRIAAVDRRLTQQSLLARLPDDERRDAVLARHARWVWAVGGISAMLVGWGHKELAEGCAAPKPRLRVEGLGEPSRNCRTRRLPHCTWRAKQGCLEQGEQQAHHHHSAAGAEAWQLCLLPLAACYCRSCQPHSSPYHLRCILPSLHLAGLPPPASRMSMSADWMSSLRNCRLSKGHCWGWGSA